MERDIAKSNPTPSPAGSLSPACASARRPALREERTVRRRIPRSSSEVASESALAKRSLCSFVKPSIFPGTLTAVIIAFMNCSFCMSFIMRGSLITFMLCCISVFLRVMEVPNAYDLSPGLARGLRRAENRARVVLGPGPRDVGVPGGGQNRGRAPDSDSLRRGGAEPPVNAGC